MDTLIQQHVISLQHQFTDLAHRCPDLVLEFQLTADGEINLWTIRGGSLDAMGDYPRQISDLIGRGSLLLGQLRPSDIGIRLLPFHPECFSRHEPWISLVLAAQSYVGGTVNVRADKATAINLSETRRQKRQIRSTAPVRSIIEIPGYQHGGLDNLALACQSAADYLLNKLLRAAAASDEEGPLPIGRKLKLSVGDREVRRDGHPSTVKFGNKDKAWRLFRILVDAGEAGKSRSELLAEVWPDKHVQDNNLDQQKQTLDTLLQCIGLRITPDKRGNWHLNSAYPVQDL